VQTRNLYIGDRDLHCQPQGLSRTSASIRFKDAETGKTLVFLTNNFTFPAATFCALYRRHWQVELFFKWIKQHLRIKMLYGNSENAVQSQQQWSAVCFFLYGTAPCTAEVLQPQRRLRLWAKVSARFIIPDNPLGNLTSLPLFKRGRACEGAEGDF